MYIVFYTFFYLISLLPWRVMYFISDGIAFILRKIIRYRVDVVNYNLSVAFPDKSAQERKKIAKKFYQQFTDSFIETIKILSISDKTFEKRYTSNIEVLDELYQSGQNIQYMAGHFFNWEFANWGVAKYGKCPFLAVYMPLSNKGFNKLIYNLRARYGSILIPATSFRNQFAKYVAKGQYGLALAADQNPGDPLQAYWINFFGRPTPFVKGPEKGAILNNTAQVFVHFYSTKRGYYHSHFEILTLHPKQYEEGQLTLEYVKLLEEKIKLNPSNYLWSHRRWKYTFDPAVHSHLLIK